jgi:hypothetical protein
MDPPITAEPRDLKGVQKPALRLHNVAGRNSGEVCPVPLSGCGIPVVGPGCSAAAADGIGTNDKIAVGIDCVSRADGDIPPSRLIVRIMPRHVGIAAQRMADQDGIVFCGV